MQLKICKTAVLLTSILGLTGLARAQTSPNSPISVTRADFALEGRRFHSNVVIRTPRFTDGSKLLNLMMNPEVLRKVSENLRSTQIQPISGTTGEFMLTLNLNVKGRPFIHKFQCSVNTQDLLFRTSCEQVTTKGETAMFVQNKFMFECHNPVDAAEQSECRYEVSGDAEPFRILMVPVSEERIATGYFKQNFRYSVYLGLMVTSDLTLEEAHQTYLGSNFEALLQQFDEALAQAKKVRRNQDERLTVELTNSRFSP
jgi:hypothetical protein